MRNINKWRKCFWRLGTFPLTSRVQHCFCSLWLLLALSFTHTGALRGNSRKLGGKFLSLFLFPPRPLLSFSYRRCLFGCDYTTTTLKWETHQNVKTKRKIHLTFNTENSILIFQRVKKKVKPATLWVTNISLSEALCPCAVTQFPRRGMCWSLVMIGEQFCGDAAECSGTSPQRSAASSQVIVLGQSMKWHQGNGNVGGGRSVGGEKGEAVGGCLLLPAWPQNLNLSPIWRLFHTRAVLSVWIFPPTDCAESKKNCCFNTCELNSELGVRRLYGKSRLLIPPSRWYKTRWCRYSNELDPEPRRARGEKTGKKTHSRRKSVKGARADILSEGELIHSSFRTVHFAGAECVFPPIDRGCTAALARSGHIIDRISSTTLPG